MFNLSKREAEIGKPHFRGEFHGEEKVDALDIPVVVFGDKDDIDMLLVPPTGKSFSDLVFSEKGDVLISSFDDIKLNRRPEGLSVTIWDNQLKTEDHIVIKSGKAKNLSIEFQKGHRCKVEFLLQVNPTKKQRERILDIWGSKRQLAIVTEQDDLFAKKDEPKKSAGEQKSIPMAEVGAAAKVARKPKVNPDIEETKAAAKKDEPIVGEKFLADVERAKKKAPKKQAPASKGKRR